MFWGAITIDGVLELQRCEERMNAVNYISILEAANIFTIANFNMVFMDDNAPIHRANAVKQWMLQYHVPSIDWPPYSPDINPIENVWAIIKNQLRRLSPAPTSLEEVAQKFVSMWNALPLDLLRKLYDGMPNRVCKCIVAKGHPIHY
jgi:transposase